MRTTLTLDDDVALKLTREMRRTGKGMKAIVNAALRRGFGSGTGHQPESPFVVEPFNLGLRPGFDPDRMNQLVDELEVEATVAKMQRDNQA